MAKRGPIWTTEEPVTAASYRFVEEYPMPAKTVPAYEAGE